MKRILVIDESEVVRETLALILGREFAVVKRPLAARGTPLADTREDVDLLIFGVTPQWGSQLAALLRLAAQLPFAVLFLVDSKSIARNIENEAEVACLAKPFNPYELHEKVGQLLARRPGFLRKGHSAEQTAARDLSGFLDFPFLSRSAASLARRFAAARLPLLLFGEMGCGQDRVAAAISGVDNAPGPRISVNAAEVTDDYLAGLRLRLSMQEDLGVGPATLVIQSLEKSSPATQSLMLDFLEGVGGRREAVRYLTTANTDLLERVYRGEFLAGLYYKLATLTLRLPPLRERGDEIPVLAQWLAHAYASELHLVEPEFSAAARQRLSSYLWFGNVCELETVVARTLACHRKARIDENDLIFDFSAVSVPEDAFEPIGLGAPRDVTAVEPQFEIYGAAATSPGLANGHAKGADLNVVIHELAHELKNPMVTIKTFAQLLGERYQDENFRSRFQEVVGGDIDRMDDLLEMMIEFADFNLPRFSRVSLAEKVRAVLARIQHECTKRQACFELKGNGGGSEVRTDEAQLEYILKNVLTVALSEARMGSEIEIDLSMLGTLALSYVREGARVPSVSQYLDEQEHRGDESVLPLRVLLAKHLLERNGGRFVVDPSHEEKEILRLEFPLAEHRHEN